MKRYLSLTMILISVLFLVTGLISCVPADKYALTVTNDGNGSVTLNPATGPYESGTVVTLTPVPNTNYEFDSWTGANASDVQETGGIYTITMNADKTIQANFVETIEQYTLTVTNDGNGSVTLDPAGGTYNSGTIVTLTPVANEYYEFDSWTGTNASDVQENAGVYTITMDANKTIQANFVEYIPYSDFIIVPGGTFTQNDITGTGFEHTIADFLIGQYEITYDLWYLVRIWAGSNGYTFANLGTEGNDGAVGVAPTTAKYEPVANISWRDAIVWCNAYSEFAGRTPVYTYNSNAIKDSSNTTACDNAVWNSAANGFRLPSEGEWQYAASYINGTNWLPYNHISGDESAPYTTSTVFGNYAWYQSNSSSATHIVGNKLENGLALYDMSGNVWEWCWDWSASLPTTAQANYTGPTTGTQHIRRGGSYDNSSEGIQVSNRFQDGPVFYHPTIGFRVVFSEPVAPTAPVFNPIPGDYSTLPQVIITSSSGAYIRYTTDGTTTPSDTVGTLYTGPVNPAGKYTFNTTTNKFSMNLKAIAYRSGFPNSSVTSGTYTITTTKDTLYTIPTAYDSLVSTFDWAGYYHAAYQDRSTWNMYYITNVGGSWSSTQLTNIAGEESPNSIFIDGQDKVHISYFSSLDTSLNYISNRSGSWVSVLIDSSYSNYGSSVVDNGSLTDFIAYVGEDRNLKFATNASGSWVTETIEDATADLSYPKMKMDTTNELHIAYGDANANLKYVTGSSGDWGTPVFVTGTNSSGGNPNDLILDSNKKVYISYIFEDDLKVANNVSGSWSISEVDTYYLGGGKMAFDSNGDLHITYNEYHAGGGNTFYYANNRSGSWEVHIIANGYYPNSVGSYSNIFINDYDVISIYHFSTNTLERYSWTW